jgi:uncharacterized membrane protein YkvA (DUF1232 family)
MTTLEARCLEAFPAWLRGLGEDARALSGLLENAEIGQTARRSAAGALNYLFKSLDLIPDGLQDLGFMDDAFILRGAAALIKETEPHALSADASGLLDRLAQEAELLREFLGPDYQRFENYVRTLDQKAARGRSVDSILTDPEVLAGFAQDVEQWASHYTTPTFTRDERNLVKLRSFLGAKLPQSN